MSQTPLAIQPPAGARYRSKTIAAWLALLLGSLGAHRLYLHGVRDRLAWLYLPPTLLGLLGLVRMRSLGPEDELGALLVPLLGVTVSLAMLAAVVTALTPDEKWDARNNAGLAARTSGWGAVIAAMIGLFIGATVLISTIAFGGQRFFEWQAEPAAVRTESR